MKKYFFLTIIIIFISCQQESQNKAPENVPLSSADSLKYNKMIEVLKKISDVDSTDRFAQTIIDAFPHQKAIITVDVSMVLYNKSYLYLSKKYFKQAAQIYKRNGQAKKYAEQLTNIGVLNEVTGNYPLAIENYLESLQIFDSLGLEINQSYVYNNLGVVYQQLGDKQSALKNYKKSLNICQSLNREDLYVSRYNNIASVFESFDNNLDSALYYYSASLKIVSKDSTNPSLPTVEANIANIYIHQQKYKLADSMLNSAFIKSDLNQNVLYSIYEFKAISALKQNDCKTSKKYAEKVIELARENSYKEHELKGLKVLIDCYEKEENFEKTYRLLQDYHQLKLEIAGIEQQKEIERLNANYNLQEKNSKIKVLELEQEVSAKRVKIWSIIGGLVILSLLILVYTFYIQKKHSQLLVKSMQRDISDYIKQLHDFEEELHEQELSHKDLFLQKVKQFDLTDREEEVLLYISQGLKNTEIAEKMFVSINTIKTHIKNIFVKMDVRNRIEAANKAKAL